MVKRKVVVEEGAEDPTPSSSSSSGIIETANAITQEQFRDVYWEPGTHDCACRPALVYAEHMDDASLQTCFALIEETSRHDYEPSSFGWHPQRKLREMKEKEMRYIMLLPEDRTLSKMKGFLSFMLTHDSVPAVPVLYVYELHLVSESRGQGLGRYVMSSAEDIARKVGVHKVMLTCFKSNEKARAFYEALGYAVDASSPEDRTTRKKVVKSDYLIMSKPVLQQSNGGMKKTVKETASTQFLRNQVFRTMSKAASCIAELPSSYILPPEVRAWIEADCETLSMSDEHLIPIVKEASRLIDKLRFNMNDSDEERLLPDVQVLTALYVGLQERFNDAQHTQFEAWSAPESIHRDFLEFGIYSLTKSVAPVGYRDLMSRLSGSKRASVPVLADYIRAMPPSMYQQMLVDFKGSDVELAAREAAVETREEELDLHEDDVYSRETALQEANERHERARQNIRARSQALKQREARFAAREERQREQMASQIQERRELQAELLRLHREMDEGLGRKRRELLALQGLPDLARAPRPCDGVDEAGIVGHLRDHHGIHPPGEVDCDGDSEKDPSQDWHEEDDEGEDELEGDTLTQDEESEVEESAEEVFDGDAHFRTSSRSQLSTTHGALGLNQVSVQGGNEFGLPKPEALQGVKVVGAKVETWLRRSGSARESFGKGRPLDTA